MPRLLASLTRTSARPATWDAFIRESVPGRWVVVPLTSGDIFVGQVDMAEVRTPVRDQARAEADMSDHDPRAPWQPQVPRDQPFDERGGYRPPKPTEPPPTGIRPPSTPPSAPNDKQEGSAR